MTPTEAVNRFADREDRKILPANVGRTAEGFDMWPLLAAACVSLAGGLPKVRTDEELDAALLFFGTMFDGGLYSYRDWEAEARQIFLGLDSESRAKLAALRPGYSARSMGGRYAMN